MKNNWHCCSKRHAGLLPATMPRSGHITIRLANIRKLMPGSRSASPEAIEPGRPMLRCCWFPADTRISRGRMSITGTGCTMWAPRTSRSPCKPPRWECNCIRWPASTWKPAPGCWPRHGKDRTCNDDDARLPRPGRPAGGAVPHPGNAAPGTQGSEELRT